jgi:hypothetical protein
MPSKRWQKKNHTRGRVSPRTVFSDCKGVCWVVWVVIGSGGCVAHRRVERSPLILDSARVGLSDLELMIWDYRCLCEITMHMTVVRKGFETIRLCHSAQPKGSPCEMLSWLDRAGQTACSTDSKNNAKLLCTLCKSLSGMVSFCANDRTICLRTGHCNLLSVGLFCL